MTLQRPAVTLSVALTTHARVSALSAARTREAAVVAAVVQAHCADCHHVVELPTERVSLLTAHGVTTYGFECPLCTAHTIRIASHTILAAFANGGVRPRLVLLSRPEIAGEPPTGPPITSDDLIDFGLELRALT